MSVHRLSYALAALVLGSLTCVPEAAAGERPSLQDPQDGAFDMGAFLDTVYGFVPVVSPITEPAVGYGAAAALVFVDRNEPQEAHAVRPNIAAIGGLATQNGTRGLFAGHIGNWEEGRLRTVFALADADVNLEFFGLGEAQDSATSGLEYSVTARGGVAGASYRLGDRPVWLGMRYAHVATNVRLRDDRFEEAGVRPDDLRLSLATVTPTITLDTRDNFFTPTRGLYLDLAAPLFRDWIGSDRDFELIKFTGMAFTPLGRTTFLGVRVSARDSSSRTPFFLRPYVSLRGVQAMKYQGEQTAEVESELRWQWRPRWSIDGFVGTGIARSERADRNLEERVTAGGIGFRYLIARSHGLHMGLDVAWGPDEPVLYVVFGSAWLRP